MKQQHLVIRRWSDQYNYFLITLGGILMKARLVPIGKSRGIRLPKAILQQCEMSGLKKTQQHPGGN